MLRKYLNTEGINAVMDQGPEGTERLRVTTTGEQGTNYDNDEFDVLTGVINKDVKADRPILWSSVTYPRVISIRTDKTITVRLNAVTNDPITVTSNDSPFELNYIQVDNIFITNTVTGATAHVSILMM
jgi:hypothetical protein